MLSVNRQIQQEFFSALSASIRFRTFYGDDYVANVHANIHVHDPKEEEPDIDIRFEAQYERRPSGVEVMEFVLSFPGAYQLDKSLLKSVAATLREIFTGPSDLQTLNFLVAIDRVLTTRLELLVTGESYFRRYHSFVVESVDVKGVSKVELWYH